MSVLLVAATDAELAGLPAADGAGAHIDVLVTGVGMVATAARVAQALARTPYGLAVNAGVCGAFDRRFPLGSVVHVVSDGFPELGVEDGARFVPAHLMGLIGPDDPPFTGGRLVNVAPPRSPHLASLPRVAGITVNTVHGDDASIAVVTDRDHPQVESMEGAAFMYACLTAGVPFAQVRAVSNYVERRNRAAWRLAEAIEALGRATATILHELR